MNLEPSARRLPNASRCLRILLEVTECASNTLGNIVRRQSRHAKDGAAQIIEDRQRRHADRSAGC
jgi:hypothetical protein